MGGPESETGSSMPNPRINVYIVNSESKYNSHEE